MNFASIQGQARSPRKSIFKTNLISYKKAMNTGALVNKDGQLVKFDAIKVNGAWYPYLANGIMYIVTEYRDYIPAPESFYPDGCYSNNINFELTYRVPLGYHDRIANWDDMDDEDLSEDAILVSGVFYKNIVEAICEIGHHEWLLMTNADMNCYTQVQSVEPYDDIYANIRFRLVEYSDDVMYGHLNTDEVEGAARIVMTYNWDAELTVALLAECFNINESDLDGIEEDSEEDFYEYLYDLSRITGYFNNMTLLMAIANQPNSLESGVYVSEDKTIRIYGSIESCNEQEGCGSEIFLQSIPTYPAAEWLEQFIPENEFTVKVINAYYSERSDDIIIKFIIEDLGTLEYYVAIDIGNSPYDDGADESDSTYKLFVDSLKARVIELFNTVMDVDDIDEEIVFQMILGDVPWECHYANFGVEDPEAVLDSILEEQFFYDTHMRFDHNKAVRMQPKLWEWYQRDADKYETGNMIVLGN